jgi:hypothetical protein
MMHLLFTILFSILPPCHYEDSTNCGWNAGTSGNGEGRSFVALHRKGSPIDLLIYRNGQVKRFNH